MAILLTGGGGYTTRFVGQHLQQAKVPFVVTSRKGQAGAPAGMQAVKFDFSDPSTYDAPFQHQFSNNEKVSAIYVVPPQAADPISLMNAFIDYAAQNHAVKRFIVVTGSSSERDGPYIGEVWRHLEEMKVEFSVIRASWFMENFSQGWWFQTISKENKFYTACGDGKAPFICANDIAALVAWCLTTKKTLKPSYRALGSELLTFDEAAAKLSKGIGRKIEHVKVSQQEVVKHYMNAGWPEQGAHFMSWIESTTADGREALQGDAVEKAAGRPPQNFDDWIQENKASWL